MRSGLSLTVVAIVATGCTHAAPIRSAPSPAASIEEVAQGRRERAEIYAAVIRHLVTAKDDFGQGRFSYRPIYLLDGPTKHAGRPRGDVFASAPRPFGSDVVAGIQELLSSGMPPLHFVEKGTEALREGKRLGEVKNGGALIVLGPIERTRTRAQVSNTFWCGGKCSQWLTYVVSEKRGRWAVRGTTGRVTMS